MKKILIVLSGILLATNTFAQTNENWCGTAQRMNNMLNNPAQALVLAQDEIIRQNELNKPQAIQKGIIYKIPVVFHVLHNGGPENTSEAQIFNALEVINRDFRKQNADTAEIVPAFQSIIGDVEIEFVLATKAPNGACFRGYTRTLSPLTFEGDDGDAQVDAVRNGNDVFQGNWPSNRYLNVYVIANAGGAGGYTNYPNNWGGTDMSNGIWILHTQFGEIGTSGTSAGRSLTHEIGHWLNLPHTWGNSNTPGAAGNCSTDDGVTDTPLCLGVSNSSCPIFQETCGSLDNVQNYMDYALSCQSMFTLGQVDRMRTAIQSSVGGRNNLWTAANLTFTGADEVILCKADFSASKTSICPGEDVQFTNTTYNVSNGWTWSFPGGSPETSTDENPIVNYAVPGVYEVELVSTDGVDSDTETKVGYITVLENSSSLPFFEGFENYTTLAGSTLWSVNNIGNNAAWQISTLASHSGVKSVRLGNFGQPDGNKDELVSAGQDLLGADPLNTTLSFRYAYRKRNSNNLEYLKVFISNNCGTTWLQKKTLGGNALSNQVVASSWTPTSSDWVTVHVTNFPTAYMVENFRYKFVFESDGGNNIFLDDINLYSGPPSEENVLELNDLANIKQLNLYPNPATSEINLSFDLATNESVELIITDVTGKVIQSNTIDAKTGKNLVMMDLENQSNGLYFVTMKSQTSQQTLQFVKK